MSSVVEVIKGFQHMLSISLDTQGSGNILVLPVLNFTGKCQSGLGGVGTRNKIKGKGNGAGLARESQRIRVPYYTRTLLVQTHTHDYSQGMCRTMSSIIIKLE